MLVELCLLRIEAIIDTLIDRESVGVGIQVVLHFVEEDVREGKAQKDGA